MACCVLAATTAFAQSTTPQNVSMINGFPPGAVVDTVGRLISTNIQGIGTVVMENKPGAGGNIAAGLVARAPADGKTLLFTAYSALLTAKAADKKGFIDPLKDLAPIAFVGRNTVLLLVRPDLPATNLRELIAYAKANPGKVSFGTNGVGSSYHLGLEQLNAEAGTKMVHVPYRGGGPALQDMLGGRLEAMFATTSLAMPHISTGRVRAIAVANLERSAQLPDIPTISESGVHGYSLDGGMGIFAPPGTPADTINSINRAVNEVLNNKKIADRLAAEGVPASPMTAQGFADHLDHEFRKAEQIIKTNNLVLK